MWRRMRSVTAFCRLGMRPHTPVCFTGPFRNSTLRAYDTLRKIDAKVHVYCIWCGKELSGERAHP